jgi:hypothetical protein
LSYFFFIIIIIVFTIFAVRETKGTKLKSKYDDIEGNSEKVRDIEKNLLINREEYESESFFLFFFLFLFY